MRDEGASARARAFGSRLASRGARGLLYAQGLPPLSTLHSPLFTRPHQTSTHVMRQIETTTRAANDLFNLTDRELWIVTAAHGDRRGALVATFVCRASLVDSLPRVLAALAKQHHTRQLVEASGCFGLHLFSAKQIDWVWRFGIPSGQQVDKLAGLACQTAVTGAPLLSEAIGWLDCRVESRMDTGDRTVYIAEVVAAHQDRSEPPLTVQELLKLAPPERRDELDQLRKRDSAIDAQAMLAWRERQAAHKAAEEPREQ